MATINWTAFSAALGDIPHTDKPAVLRTKSRDYYWYSPILKAALEPFLADLVVTPRSEQDVITVLRLAFAHDVPVVARGAGTGNYGQVIPLKGGIVLDMSEMTAVRWVRGGAVRVQAGAKLIDIDKATQATCQQELRLHPSTHRTATVGGFVAGGSSGCGSVTWGLLRDAGNILGLRVVTLQAEPRVLELRGEDIQQVNHAYGTNGVITEVEMPLATAWGWRDMIVGFDDFMAAVHFANDIAEMPGILKKNVAVIAAPVPQQYFRNLSAQLPAGQHVVMLIVAETADDPTRVLIARHKGRLLYTHAQAEPSANAPLYEYCWNHTTLQALSIDRSITYLQTLFPPPDHRVLIERMHEYFGDEVPMHLEFVRIGGQIACFGLQLVRYTTEARLREIIAYHERHGCTIFNPHAFTLEEGGMKAVDRAQLSFKRQADPKGLLNPGKMIAWDNPAYNPANTRGHLYPDRTVEAVP
jgi:FAD/FMN-containing dehydrogenase